MKLNKNTQKAQSFITAYISSEYDINTSMDIYKVYGRPSNKKIGLINHYLSNIYEEGGEDIKITSFNDNFFTLGYISIKDNKKYLNIITYSNNYEIEL